MIRLARIHLDPIGGLAGDMFAAAMADAFPECVPGLWKELRKLKSPSASGEGQIRFLPHTDAFLRGQRFVVDMPESWEPAHQHVPHRRIREQLREAGLQPKVLEHALGLFQTLADAEARVHGVSAEEVEFHEVGAWDSVVDFVAAAYFIATLSPERWTCAPLPLGGGRVRTAHGVLPLPAPATTLLLQGLDVVDDGIGGERVTPTGATIARYLLDRGQTLFPAEPGASSSANKSLSPVVVAASGHGFGTFTLPGLPNMLRVLAFAAPNAVPGPQDEEIATLQFEIDDQTAEDLAVALERIREVPGVLDVAQVAVYGKKNRLATQVQVLARLEAADAAAQACLAQTTTLGVRIARACRRTLPRAQVQTREPEPVRVKLAQRPSSEVTAKAEMDDIARIPGGRAEREEARRRAESSALESHEPHEPRDD